MWVGATFDTCNVQMPRLARILRSYSTRPSRSIQVALLDKANKSQNKQQTMGSNHAIVIVAPKSTSQLCNKSIFNSKHR